MSQREGTLFLSDWALIDPSSRHHVDHVTGFLWALSARRILIVQIPRTAAASRARSSRLVLPTGCRSSAQLFTLSPAGLRQRWTHKASCREHPPSPTDPPLALSGGPYHFLPRPPGPGLFFPDATTSPLSGVPFNSGFRWGWRIPQLPPTSSHPTLDAPDWPSSHFIAVNIIIKLQMRSKLETFFFW